MKTLTYKTLNKALNLLVLVQNDLIDIQLDDKSLSLTEITQILDSVNLIEMIKVKIESLGVTNDD